MIDVKEIVEVVRMMDPNKDYHFESRKEGSIIHFTISEKPGGNLPAEKKLKRHDAPADILQMLECDGGELDEMVHDAKGHEASAINNEGYWSQLDYLVGSGWTDWAGIREYLKGNDGG